jgi:ketosteroid isomerase-like protein
MSSSNLELLKGMLPSPDTDVANLLRDERLFTSTSEALGGLFQPDVVSVPAWRGGGITYSGVEGFREMWLDWLQPWASYHVQVEEMIEAGESIVVLVRDRARRQDMDVEVELISGSVWKFRDGKIARVEFYANREELKEATSLSS